MSGPIFVVGGSRCGTELVRQTLNRHPAIYLAVETHWFDDMRPRLRHPANPAPSERDAILDYLLSVDRHGYGLRATAISKDAKEALDRRWQATGAHADAAFEAFCRAKMEAEGACRWGEKTPRHLFRVPEILGVWPDAKIVICLRDPRGAVASYKDWTNNWFDLSALSTGERSGVEAEERRVRASYDLTIASLMWRSAARAGIRAREAYSPERVRLQRFEDLVARPEPQLREIAEWLDVDFDEAMLAASLTNSSYASEGSAPGFQTGPLERYRTRLNPQEIAYIEALTRRERKLLYYADSDAALSPNFALRQAVKLPPRIVRAFLANRRRMGSLTAFLQRHLRGF